MTRGTPTNQTAETHPGSIGSYTTGFILSIVLTLIPYVLVTERVLDGLTLLLSLAFFAIAQLIVQLVFFLHLGRGPGSRWNLVVFFFMVLIVLIIVIGSVWIMNNLDYNMMLSPEEMDAHMQHQGEKGF